ncbi:MAG: hypothetical protein KIT58_16520, partial [Planctomycetota bacterium]|nr:hypothetical protein [Planctomycetota bacterium]
EGWHTYFVAGELNAPAVWVHNACAPTRTELLERLPERVYAGRIVDPRFNARMATPKDFNPRAYTIRAGEFEGRMIGHKHGINPEQTAPIRAMSNEDLVRFRFDDPISSHGIKNGIDLTGGHHRTAEIIRRVKAGEMAPDTEIHLLIHD